MNKLLDNILGSIFFIFSIILCIYVLSISSDIPVGISINEFIISVMSLVVFSILYSFYIKKSESKSIGIVLIIPLLVWFLFMIGSIKNNYLSYNAMIAIMGFVIMLFCSGLTIYKSRINKKSV